MSTVISAQLVKELRDQTGAPMMDTKRALQEAEGDMEVAKRLLRERGMASAAKRASRETTEGTVGYRIADDGRVHPPANKVGVRVQLRGGSPELGRKVAMHIAAMNPSWIDREGVPEEDVERERQIFLATDEVQSKPEQAREKIVEGMLNKRFFGANVLVDQEWIHDSGKKVADVLAEENAEVLEFERFELSA